MGVRQSKMPIATNNRCLNSALCHANTHWPDKDLVFSFTSLRIIIVVRFSW